MMKITSFISLSKSFNARLEELLRFEKGDTFSKIDKSWTIRLSAVLEKPQYHAQVSDGFIKGEAFKEFEISNVVPFFSSIYERITHYYVEFSNL